MSEANPHVFALILAGGAGTRFWPASRKHRPKQLLPLCGDEPMILETARRLLPLCGGWKRTLVASGKHLAAPTRDALPELPSENLLLEPVPRNTAPCIAWAAATVARRDPEAILVVVPSDSTIEDVDAYRVALTAAVQSAEAGRITTIGIRPNHPETGYGYVELEAPFDWKPPIRAVAGKRFVEKPDRAKAEAFVAGGRHLWNAGMFIFRARDMLDAVRAHLPELAEGIAAFDAAAARGDEASAVDGGFGNLPAVSIDFGVMEHLSELAVVPGDFGWSDVGSWQSAWELAEKDDAQNHGPDGSVFVEASGNHVVDLRQTKENAPKKVIAMVGVDDLVVVETDDALLVLPRGRSQDVRQVVDELKRRGSPLV